MEAVKFKISQIQKTGTHRIITVVVLKRTFYLHASKDADRMINGVTPDQTAHSFAQTSLSQYFELLGQLKKPILKMLMVTLTHCLLVYSSTVICWTTPFVILVVLGLFYSISDGKSCNQTM